MSVANPLQALPGPFNFLRPTEEELARVWPGGSRGLPAPQRIFLVEEESTPVLGFPVLVSDGLKALAYALQLWVHNEEQVLVQRAQRREVDRKSQESSWNRYRKLLSTAAENVTISSYGRPFAEVFWLHHSLLLARLLKETPRRVARLSSEVARTQGNAIKYRILHRYLDRVVSLVYDLASSISESTEQPEEELFPWLLDRMRDNVLILTEDHIGKDLAELGSYFQGVLHIEGRDLRQRLEALDRWHLAMLPHDPGARAMAAHLAGADDSVAIRDLRFRPGYLTYLEQHPAYLPEGLPSPEQIRVWESLLLKLKEFELLNALRRMVIPVVQGENGYVCHDRTVTLPSGAVPLLSSATRPMDFTTSWVVDPTIERFGMIYDITDFTQIVSHLRRSASAAQDLSFRRMVGFQRRVNNLADQHRIQLEKYLGDGAFYSSRHPARLLYVAVHIQRYYRSALEEGFDFDRGMRIALNYGRYRLIPIQGQGPGEERYEFFGHGIVELSRLTTGKKSREIAELQHLLVSRGYQEAEVASFFAPLAGRGVDVVDRSQAERPFYAYVNQNGTLVNEGIVATEPFLDLLVQEIEIGPLALSAVAGSGVITLELSVGGHRIWVGIRKLGQASLKGMEETPIYEIVDGEDLGRAEPLETSDLKSAIERQFALEQSGSVA